MNKNILKNIKDLIITVLIAIVIGTIISNHIISNAEVPTGSMETTIDTNSFIIVNRTAYWFNKPERLDIVVFYHPDINNKLLVKRIIGMPGDTVEIKNGKLYINDKEIDESTYVSSNLNDNWGPYNVPDNSYFMLGDNRAYSHDARYWDNKYVSSDYIIGEAVFEYKPHFKWLLN